MFAALEAHLQRAFSIQLVSIERVDSAESLVVVEHVHKSVSLASLVGLVSNHLDVSDGSVGSKQLPQETVLAVCGEVVHKDAPSLAVVGHGLKVHVRYHIWARHWVEPGVKKKRNQFSMIYIPHKQKLSIHVQQHLKSWILNKLYANFKLWPKCFFK